MIGRLVLSAGAAAILAAAGAPAATEFPHVETGDTAWGWFGRSVWARVWVKAPPAAVFAVLTDYAQFPAFMPLVERVEVLERSPRHAVLRLSMRYSNLFEIQQTDRRELFGTERITYVGIAGTLREVHGDWTLAGENDGTRVHYTANVDPGVPLPGALTGALMKRGLPGLLDGIKRRVESGGTWTKRRFP